MRFAVGFGMGRAVARPLPFAEVFEIGLKPLSAGTNSSVHGLPKEVCDVSAESFGVRDHSSMWPTNHLVRFEVSKNQKRGLRLETASWDGFCPLSPGGSGLSRSAKGF